MDQLPSDPVLDRFHPHLKYMPLTSDERELADSLLSEADSPKRPFNMDSFALRVFHLLYSYAPFSGSTGFEQTTKGDVPVLARTRGKKEEGWAQWEFEECLSRVFKTSPSGMTRLPMLSGVTERLLGNKRIVRLANGDLAPRTQASPTSHSAQFQHMAQTLPSGSIPTHPTVDIHAIHATMLIESCQTVSLRVLLVMRAAKQLIEFPNAQDTPKWEMIWGWKRQVGLEVIQLGNRRFADLVKVLNGDGSPTQQDIVVLNRALRTLGKSESTTASEQRKHLSDGGGRRQTSRVRIDVSSRQLFVNDTDLTPKLNETTRNLLVLLAAKRKQGIDAPLPLGQPVDGENGPTVKSATTKLRNQIGVDSYRSILKTERKSRSKAGGLRLLDVEITGTPYEPTVNPEAIFAAMHTKGGAKR